MAKKKTKKAARKSTSKTVYVKNQNKRIGLAIIALILNILILPGLGSLIGKRIKTGIWQIAMFLVGAFLTLFFIPLGILSFAAWIWGIVTGINLVREAD